MPLRMEKVGTHILRRLSAFLLLFLHCNLWCGTGTVMAQNSGNDLNFGIRVAAFKSLRGATRYELYFSVPTRHIGARTIDGTLRSTLEMHVTVDDAQMQRLFESYDVFYVPIQHQEQKNHIYVGQINFEIDLGLSSHLLHVVAQLKNPESGQSGMRATRLQHASFRGAALQLSDLQFATKIIQDAAPGRFTKNGLMIQPYPLNISVKQSVVYIYYEIYGLSVDDDDNAQYTIEYSVVALSETLALPFVDNWGLLLGPAETSEEGFTMLTQDHIRKGADQFEHTSIDMSLLEPGLYRFQVRVRDWQTNAMAEVSNEFTAGVSGETP